MTTNELAISNADVVLRLLVTLVLTGLIGMERKHYRKPAGFRTNILVGIGASILVMMAAKLFQDFNPSQTVDIGHIIGPIVTGIGFLGAGAVIQARGSVHGLTTAATLWVVAAIGITSGLGYYFLAVSSTLVVLLVLEVFGRIEFKLTNEQIEIKPDSTTDQQK